MSSNLGDSQIKNEENWRGLNQASDAALSALWHQTLEERLTLDMTRGKPAAEQLDLCNDLVSGSLLGRSSADFRSEDGTDCRNYGGLDGIPEAKRLFAEYLQVRPENVLIGGNSSLALMHDTVAALWLKGTSGNRPWNSQPVKFLCPVPGYDRHFAICEKFGIEMIQVPLNDDGPDMEIVKKLVLEDASIKGIWCVPKYSNPSGIVYSNQVISELSSMKAAADFRIFWDNAYQAHHLTNERIEIPDILEISESYGNSDRVFIFGSTSKITLPGAGVAMMAASPANLSIIKGWLSIQTVGPDKLNQLRHVRFLKDLEGIYAIMKKHAEIIRPKFDVVSEVLANALGNSDICSWTSPKGGYFLSLTLSKTVRSKLGRAPSAKRVVALANSAGVKLTPAGATHPYGNDPDDATLRIAPTLPRLADVKRAAQVLALCVVLEGRGIDIS
jgi:DNA-binding transcriptional MocR family regulator